VEWLDVGIDKLRISTLEFGLNPVSITANPRDNPKIHIFGPKRPSLLINNLGVRPSPRLPANPNPANNKLAPGAFDPADPVIPNEHFLPSELSRSSSQIRG
jgi:hypothetical protein